MLTKPKVLLISNFIDDNQESMIRFGAYLQEGLQSRGMSCVLIQPKAILSRYAPIFLGIKKWLGYIDKFLIFPFYLSKLLRLGSYSVVHIVDHSNAPYLKYLKFIPVLITCHDILAIRSSRGHFSKNKVRWSGRWLQKWISYWLEQAKFVTFVTDTTRRQFEEQISRPLIEKTIHQGLTYPYKAMEQAQVESLLRPLHSSILNKPYFLHVGSNSWYKNKEGLLELFSKIKRMHGSSFNLILTGEPLNKSLWEKAVLLDINDAIIQLGCVSDISLNALYSGAKALIFPSIIEGFGWPILEAMAAGCPVITTRENPMVEVAQDAALYLPAINFNDDNLSDWVAKSALVVSAFINEPDSQVKARVYKGYLRVNNLAELNSIDQYIDFYHTILASK